MNEDEPAATTRDAWTAIAVARIATLSIVAAVLIVGIAIMVGLLAAPIGQ